MVTVGVPFYGMPFFYDYFIREFGWTRAQTTSGIALATMLVQPVGGILIHRFSARKLILFGSAMLLVSMLAFGAGKDIYLEKPMTYTIEEAKTLAAEVRKTNRVLQVGAQWCSAKPLAQDDLLRQRTGTDVSDHEGAPRNVIEEEAARAARPRTFITTIAT